MKQIRHKGGSITKQLVRDYLFVSLSPVLIIVILTSWLALISINSFVDIIESPVDDLNKDAEAHLRHLGQKLIENKARDVAGQIEVFLLSHPNMSMADFQKNPTALGLALQKVGKSGYTCVYEAKTGIMRIHPNPTLINRKMHFLAEKLPSWWKIFEPTLQGVEISGFYQWIEPDGSVRDKYMSMTPVAEKLEGRLLMVAATTYIDEFSAPVSAIRAKARNIVAHYRKFIIRQGTILGVSIAAFLLLASIFIYILGRRSAMRYTLPIEELANAAGRLGDADWELNISDDLCKRDDEIGFLANAFDRMSRQLKALFGKLEQQVEELNHTQKALKDSERHYRSLFDGVPIGLYRTTPDGKIQDSNNYLVDMLGYPDRKAFISSNAMDVYANIGDRIKWQAKMELHPDYVTSETRMCRYDGTIIWVENLSRAVRDADGKICHYEGSLKEITERKRAEAALRKSEDNYRRLYEKAKNAESVYRSLINSSADAIVIYNLKGETQFVNPEFTRVFGWTIDEIRGKNVPFLPPFERDVTMKYIDQLVREGVPCQGFETRRFTKEGRLVDVNISASRYEDHEGKPAGLLVILRDVSDKKRLQGQLQQAERMEAIGTLAGGIAHDFNNLMMGMLGNVSLMIHDMEETHPHYRYLQNIEKQIQSGSKLTGQLLGYARKGKYEIKPVDLNAIIRDTSETFGRTMKGINFEFNLSDDIFSIDADRNQIEQVLLNLYVNASDAMPDGGKLSITTINTTHEAMRNKPIYPNPGNYVLLEIRDTGVGMPETIKSKIFDPFFTTKEMGRGTGLGLASVYGIIKAHGGFIEVESKVGWGTRFNIFLPSSDKQSQQIRTTAGQIESCSGTILLVDDEKMVLDIGVEMLDRMGYTVLKADSGQGAIRIVKKHKDLIHLVILDMVMPDMNGGMVFDELRSINPELKILLSSGYSIDGEAEKIMARGCNGFLQKPFSMDSLNAAIRELLLDQDKSDL